MNYEGTGNKFIRDDIEGKGGHDNNINTKQSQILSENY